MAWAPAIKFCQEVLGPDRVLYAMDYPYQVSAEEVAAYDALDIPPEHKRMLMQTNADTSSACRRWGETPIDAIGETRAQRRDREDQQ